MICSLTKVIWLAVRDEAERPAFKPGFVGALAVLTLTVLAAEFLVLPTVAFGQTVVPTRKDCNFDKPETTPISRFRIDEQAGAVFDTQTELTWKRCAEGQTYAAGRCEGVPTLWNWHDAVQQFGVQGDGWRIPNVDELSSIVENRCYYPSANLALFPDTPPSAFWSASSSASNPGSAWRVSFVAAGIDEGNKSDGYPVRLVRGKEWIDPSGILRKARKAEQAALKAEQERAKAAKDRILNIAALIEAERKAVISCRDKAACDKAFSLTQIYINQTSDQKIQIATDTIVETYNPTEESKLGLAATRIPGKGASASIRLRVTCNDGRFAFDLCLIKKRIAYEEFRPFIERMLKE